MTLKDKIEELEQKYRLVSDNQTDAVWVIDEKTHVFEYITPSIYRMTGYTPDDYLNAPVEKFVPADHIKKIFNLLAEEKKIFIEQGISNIHTIEAERILKDGSKGWIEVRARLYREKNKPIKIVGITRDINKRKQAELKRNELIKKLEQALVEKEKLLEENKILRGLLPICSGCKRIRAEDGGWWPLDAYVRKKTGAELTHTICSDCQKIYYNDQ